MIKNKTRKKVVGSKPKYCLSPFSKALGLMFSLRRKSTCLVFVFENERKIALHMFFVFYPIDILFLDKNKKIVDMRESAKPFQPFIQSKKPAKYVVELPTSTIARTKTRLGDQIEFGKNM